MPGLPSELQKLERRLTEISDEIFSTTAKGLDAKLLDIERFVMQCLSEIHQLLTGDIPPKSELAKHCREITLTPEGRTYQMRGDWKLLSGRSDSAGGPAWTERLPVHFEWQAAV